MSTFPIVHEVRVNGQHSILVAENNARQCGNTAMVRSSNLYTVPQSYIICTLISHCSHLAVHHSVHKRLLQ